MKNFQSTDTRKYGDNDAFVVQITDDVEDADKLLDYIGDQVIIDGKWYQVAGLESSAAKSLKQGEDILIIVAK